MRRLMIGAASVALLLTGCSSQVPAQDGMSAEEAPTEDQAFLAEHDLAGNAVQVIDHLDRLGGSERPAELMASVRPGELLLSDEDVEVSLPVPEDRFYLSVAPYVQNTHDCFHHSLTTCQGELAGEQMHVKITDQATGKVLVDDEVTTFDNGFVGFWLPRDMSGTVEVTYGERSGAADFVTGEDDPTCLTTLQLA